MIKQKSTLRMQKYKKNYRKTNRNKKKVKVSKHFFLEVVVHQQPIRAKATFLPSICNLSKKVITLQQIFVQKETT